MLSPTVPDSPSMKTLAGLEVALCSCMLTQSVARFFGAFPKEYHGRSQVRDLDSRRGDGADRRGRPAARDHTESFHQRDSSQGGTRAGDSDAALVRAGYRVLRLDAALVTEQLAEALERIRAALARRLNR